MINTPFLFFGSKYGARMPGGRRTVCAVPHGCQASIVRHATDRPPGSLDDPALVREGARAYSQRGCTNCHAGPGAEPDAFSARLNPPPNLKEVVNVLPPRELFWEIKNGIKMTGMPSFGASDLPCPTRKSGPS
jgi:hypothetical protein